MAGNKEMSDKRAGDIFPYLLVNEALNKCQVSERFRTHLAQRVGMRADIEIEYIKKLQEWMNDLDLPTTGSEGPDAYSSSEIIKKITDGLRQEAHMTAESRQKMYNCLMSDTGPYVNLQRLSVDGSQRTVQETGTHFSQLFKQRNDVDKTYQHHIEMSEHLRNQIEALETKLSMTSRIASSRRSAGKNRKIDGMREQLSELRFRYDEEQIEIEKYESELQQMESAAQQLLADMEKTLRDIEMARVQTYINIVKSYIESVQKNQTQKSKSPSPLGSLEAAQKLVRLHWLDVRSRAKQGDVPNIQNMFESSTNSKKNFVSARNVLDKVLAESEDNNEASQICDKTDSLLTYFNSRKSGSESSVDEGASAMGVIGNMEYKRINTFTKPAKNPSHESIESLELPPEVKCEADISKIEPNKQYVTRMRLAKQKDDVFSPRAHMTEYSNIRRYTSPEVTDEDDDVNNVAKLHNVRVVAIEDSDPLPDSEFLAFRRGQIIKQKMGENENGYCYGWTRENRIGKKQYGIYKTCMVKLYRKSTNI